MSICQLCSGIEKRKAKKKWMSANALAGNIFVTLTSLADEN